MSDGNNSHLDDTTYKSDQFITNCLFKTLHGDFKFRPKIDIKLCSQDTSMHQSPEPLHHGHHHSLMPPSLGLGPAQSHHLHHLQPDPFHSAHLSEYSHRSADLADASETLAYYDLSQGLGDLSQNHAGSSRAGQYTPSPSDDSHCESPSQQSRGDILESSILNTSSYLPPSYHIPLQVSTTLTVSPVTIKRF